MAGVITRDDVLRSLDAVGVKSELTRDSVLFVYAALVKWRGRSRLAEHLETMIGNATERGLLDLALAPILIAAVSMCREEFAGDPMCSDVNKLRRFITARAMQMPATKKLKEMMQAEKDRKRISRAWRTYLEKAGLVKKRGLLARLFGR